MSQVAKELELADDALRFSYNVFENYGNILSPSVLFVLREILDSGRPQHGQKGMLLALGAGRKKKFCWKPRLAVTGCC